MLVGETCAHPRVMALSTQRIVVLSLEFRSFTHMTIFECTHSLPGSQCLLTRVTAHRSVRGVDENTSCVRTQRAWSHASLVLPAGWGPNTHRLLSILGWLHGFEINSGWVKYLRCVSACFCPLHKPRKCSGSLGAWRLGA